MPPQYLQIAKHMIWRIAHPAGLLPLGTAPPRRYAAMCDSPIGIRVCTFGGEGRCSGGDGEAAVAALRFLSPETGFEITSCSCLARCDRGVVAQLRNDGTIEEGLNDAKACSRWLRRLGVSVDARLRDAFDEQRAGADFEQAGEMVKALEAYNRAFGLATAAGLGVKWRSRPSPVLKAQPGESSRLPSTSNAYEAETPKASQAQLAWLSSLMVARSRVFSFLAGQKWPKAQRRALEDAQYAVQIAGAALPNPNPNPNPNPHPHPHPNQSPSLAPTLTLTLTLQARRCPVGSGRCRPRCPW